MDDEREQGSEEAIEGTLGKWRFRASDAPGEIIFSSEGDEERLWLTGGEVLEAYDTVKGGQELYVRTERYEHTVRRDPREQKWRVIFTKGSAHKPPETAAPDSQPRAAARTTEAEPGGDGDTVAPDDEALELADPPHGPEE